MSGKFEDCSRSRSRIYGNEFLINGITMIIEICASIVSQDFELLKDFLYSVIMIPEG